MSASTITDFRRIGHKPPGNARSSGYARHAADWYVEPRWSIDVLLDAEKFEGDIWDPACGGGNILRACRDRGMIAIGSDIVQRGAADSLGSFLDDRRACDNIITNPPFCYAEDFARHALRHARRKVAILGRLAFLEGQKRRQMFEGTPLAKVWVFSSRVSMPPGDSGAMAKGGSVAFAWFVWEHGHSGPPTLGWLP